MPLKIKSGHLISQHSILEDSCLTLDNGKIISVGSDIHGPVDYDFSEYTVVPGFIDIHTHGYYGIDSFSSSDSEIREWAQKITETGVTSFIPSLVSLPLNDIYGQFERYRTLTSPISDGAQILGVRCEGPYLSEEKRGAHNIANLRVPETSEINEFFRKGSGILKIIDIAPELGDIRPIVELAKKHGIVVSTGHSNATYSTAMEAFEAGSPLVTHFYNAMSTMSHREVGLVGAGLLNSDVNLELIADLHHVSGEAIEIMNKMKGFKNTALITDSLAVGGAQDSKLTLGGLPVTLHDGVAWIGDTDTIAGSVLTLDNAVRNLMSLGYGLEELIYSTSGLQSNILGLKDRGSIAPGYRADLCVLDEAGNVMATFVNGELAYKNF